MASCGYPSLRLDHLDWNEVSFIHLSRMIYDGSDAILLCYSQAATEPASATQANVHRVYFRRYTISSGTLTAAVQVSDNNSGTGGASSYNPREPSMIRLTDGRLIVAWQGAQSGALQPCKIRESTDNGDTWGSITTVMADPNGDGTPVNETNGHLSTDGTNVWFFIEGSGSPIANDIYWWVRVSEGTWTAKGRIFDGPGVEEGFWMWDDNEQNLRRSHYMLSATTGFFIADYLKNSDGGTIKNAAYWTKTATDPTPVWTKTDVGTWTTNGKSYPRIVPSNLSDGKIRVAWINEPGGAREVRLAYTEDQGESWTIIGTPAAMSGIAIGTDHWATAMDAAGNWYVGYTFNTLPGVSNFRLWRGGDSTGGWELIADCENPEIPNTNPPEDMLIVGTDIYYAYGYTDDANSDGVFEWHLAFVKIAGVAEVPEGPEEPETALGYFRRGVLQVEEAGSDYTGGEVNVVSIEKARDPLWGGR